MHARAVGGENPRDLDLDLVLAVVIEEKGLSEKAQPVTMTGLRCPRIRNSSLLAARGESIALGELVI
jgi:hypothetical protein